MDFYTVRMAILKPWSFAWDFTPVTTNYIFIHLSNTPTPHCDKVKKQIALSHMTRVLLSTFNPSPLLNSPLFFLFNFKGQNLHIYSILAIPVRKETMAAESESVDEVTR